MGVILLNSCMVTRSDFGDDVLVGLGVGFGVGLFDGLLVGFFVGPLVGRFVGSFVGARGDVMSTKMPAPTSSTKSVRLTPKKYSNFAVTSTSSTSNRAVTPNSGSSLLKGLVSKKNPVRGGECKRRIRMVKVKVGEEIEKKTRTR